MNQESRIKLDEIFRSVFELGAEIPVTDINRSTHPKWDSMAQVTLIAAIESEFGLDLDTVDSLALDSYRAAERLLSQRGLS